MEMCGPTVFAQRVVGARDCAGGRYNKQLSSNHFFQIWLACDIVYGILTLCSSRYV